MDLIAWLFLAPLVVLATFARHPHATCNLVERSHGFVSIPHCWCDDDNFETDGWVA